MQEVFTAFQWQDGIMDSTFMGRIQNIMQAIDSAGCFSYDMLLCLCLNSIAAIQ
jgi:hypothetical protein